MSRQLNNRKDRKKKERGFTLIEIMVVVMIIGMLAALVGVNVISRLEDAKRKAAATQIKQIEQALQLYYLDNGFYPSTEQGLDALVQAPSTSPQPKNYKQDGYLNKIPLDPWQNEYVYANDGNKIYIESYGADGQDGGEERDADIESWNLDQAK